LSSCTFGHPQYLLDHLIDYCPELVDHQFVRSGQ